MIVRAQACDLELRQTSRDCAEHLELVLPKLKMILVLSLALNMTVFRGSQQKVASKYTLARDYNCIDFKSLCLIRGFYCATIAYHGGLNAVLGWPQGLRPTSKKNRHL